MKKEENKKSLYLVDTEETWFLNSVKSQSVSKYLAKKKKITGVLHKLYPLWFSVYFVSLAKHLQKKMKMKILEGTFKNTKCTPPLLQHYSYLAKHFSFNKWSDIDTYRKGIKDLEQPNLFRLKK